ncbi:F-box domain-containing protein [Colletotrichum cuscutae]|uniref:F-box domain-containing protein n=1 Tax=Colletotrichum cuscutae TaxID=1209917 RepID=A0AAI9VCZ9_9PEZI|nr:F-box domain-containing protein [Colletotrichum cuscutae]
MVEVLPSGLAQNGQPQQSQDSADHVASVARLLLATNLASRQENKMMTREERQVMIDELSKKRAGWRTPRRGWSITDSPVASAQGSPAPQATASPYPAPPSTQHEAIERHAIASVPEQSELPMQDMKNAPQPPQVRRPPLPPPRRSYSVTDYEPPARIHRPSARMDIFDLPAELHYAIFDHLDPIDSTCFGLTNSHFYDIHRRMHGPVPLTSRRNGPNDLEWAWRFAGPLIYSDSAAPPPEAFKEHAHDLERMRVKGQVYCRKCGISRCELHRHLKEWMGPNLEYCTVTQKYGPLPSGEAADTCYIKSPKNPHRCGRHAAKPVKSHN